MSRAVPTRPREATSGTRGTVHTIHYDLSYVAYNLADPAAPTVVFLHGFPGDATAWEAVIAGLGGRQMIAFDMLGFGRSEHPWPADASVWGHADTLNGAIRALGLRQVVLVGTDLGGGVAQVLATRLMPELTRGLVLLDSAAFQMSYHPDFPLPQMDQRRDPEAAMHTSLAEVEAALRQALPQGSATPEKLTGQALEQLVRPWLDELGKECLFQQIRGLVPSYLNAVAADLAHLTLPTLIIWGAQDAVFPLKWGQFLQRTIPASRLEVVPGAGHLILIDAAPAVTQLLSTFLAAQ